MRSLYWKIFLTFWLSLLVFAGMSFWLTSHYIESIRAETLQSNPRHDYMRYRQQAVQISRSKKLDELREWLRELDKREAIPYLLLDENGVDMLKRPVPLRLKQRVARFEQRWRNQFETHGDDDHDEYRDRHNHREHDRRPHTVPIIIEPHRYWLLPDTQSITLGRLLQRPRVILIPILVAMLVSGIVVFLLARYLTLPITRLRSAAQKLSDGKLDTRVTPLMGARRDELAELANDFDYMAERLQVLLASHKQLLSDASHELRSPLARLQVALGLVQQRNPEAITNELQRIELEAERLNDLIGQLLSLSRLDNQQQLDTETVDFDSLLATVVEDADYEAQAQQKNVSLLNNTKVKLAANSALLSSALENVVRNAIRYTPQDTTVEITSELDNQASQIKLSICDQGPGIPEEMLEKIFDPFVRVGEARDRQSGGYGLGLAIARRAVALHGGKISARNHTPNGLCIEIELPVNLSS
jgi:two-component system sensor histidine kinase CpxA